MLHQTLTVNLCVFGGVSIVLNVISIWTLVRGRKSRRLKEEEGGKSTVRIGASELPLLLILLTDILLSSMLAAPASSFITETGVFTACSCNVWAAADMTLSLFQVALATAVAFDRYIVTIQPKWGKWRSHTNYIRMIVLAFLLCLAWSTVPILGYGRYSTFHHDAICSLDWRQGELTSSSDPSARDAAHGYIALLTATFLLFFLIPVCTASSLYYSVVEHVDRLNSAEQREENAVEEACPWAPPNFVATVGLGCLLATTVPLLSYAVVSLNPLAADFSDVRVVTIPLLLSRIAPIANPLFYVWLNPSVCGLQKAIQKRQKKRTPPRIVRPNGYQTIGLIAEVSGMSFPILTPAVSRRQLPQIPAHLLSPSPTPQCSYLGEMV